MRTKIDVANAALAMVGADRIAEFDDGSAEGEVVSRVYETVVGQALTTPGGAPFRWSFATMQAQLARLEAPPLGRYAFSYQQPSDLLRLHAVTRDGALVPHAIHGDRIVTDQDGILIADYTFRADESAWPPDFYANVVRELAAQLAVSLNRDQDLAKGLGSNIPWPGARTGDSQARTPPRLRFTRLTAARFGGSSWRDRRPGDPPPDDVALVLT